MSAYELIIAGSFLIILSYLFNIIARSTGIPSIIFLIGTGIIIKILLPVLDVPDFDFQAILEVLGIIGLIMIVLEASLDLKISKEKKTVITRSLSIAFLSLIFTGIIISFVVSAYLETTFLQALVYALPLSVISSAIVIPSTSELPPDKKEFLIYESTFSDILGIMLFYFLLESKTSNGFWDLGFHILLSLSITIIISFALSYLLIFIFQNIRSNVKLFLLISTLILLYSIAKTIKLSSLLLILVFGLILENRRFFFRGKLRNLIKEGSLREISKDFRILTLESSFVVRTFFFILFGIALSPQSIFDPKVWLVSLIVIIAIYGVRFIILKILHIKTLFPELLLAPRGLITILLFYAIPEEFVHEGFNPGIVLMVIIVSSLAMTGSLVFAKKRSKLEVSFPERDDKR